MVCEARARMDAENDVDGTLAYRKQVKAYQKGESAFHSFYLVIIISERKKNDQLSTIQKLYKASLGNNEKMPELFIIDGLKHPSPSKLK